MSSGEACVDFRGSFLTCMFFPPISIKFFPLRSFPTFFFFIRMLDFAISLSFRILTTIFRPQRNPRWDARREPRLFPGMLAHRRTCHILYLLNLLHYQTYSYSRHFTSTCIRVCGYETNARGIDVEGHVTAVMHCPVGVDAERVARDM